mgnify:CR=1 FL=1
MGELIFIGLGLFDEKDITIKGLELAKSADKIYAEFYTGFLAGTNIRKIEELVGKTITVLDRKSIEVNPEKTILKEAISGKVALLVVGDPMMATTHIDLRLRAHDMGIKTKVAHGPSIFSAAPGIAGLQGYKFGKSVTIPFPEPGYFSETPYEIIKNNYPLHTLLLLDVKAEEQKIMTANEGLKILLKIEEERKEKVLTENRLAIVIAKAGSLEPIIKADYIKNLINGNFGPPPHVIIIPGQLHFMEAEALVKIASAPREILEKK